MTLSVLIVEDEFIIVQDIKAALIASGYSVFGIARSYKQAVELLKKGKPDFALVDITLSATGQSGLDLGRLLNQDLQVPFIYVTSHGDLATLEKVKLTNPSGYLLKPFRREAIHAAIEVAMVHVKRDAEASPGSERFITLKKGEEKFLVNYSEILFLESDGNYTNIQTVTSKFTERKTLKDLLDEMHADAFMRVHKSYAVNRNKVHHFTREKIFLAGHEIPIGRTYAEELGKSLS